MPTYEYQCKSCNHRFEIWQKMTDEPLTTCPECSGTIRRVLFPAGIVFKGSGFYKTDHGSGAPASDNTHNGTDEAKESTPKTENASETKTSNEKTSETASASNTQSSNKAQSSNKVSAAAD
jgi:putative FmdB family regulatory protein